MAFNDRIGGFPEKSTAIGSCRKVAFKEEDTKAHVVKIREKYFDPLSMALILLARYGKRMRQ